MASNSLTRGRIAVRDRAWLAVLSVVIGFSLPYLIGAVFTLSAVTLGRAGEGNSISAQWNLAVAAGDFFRVAMPSMLSVVLAICVFVGTTLLSLRRKPLLTWMISGAGLIAAAYLIAVEVIYPDTIAGGLAKFDASVADRALQVSIAAVLGAVLGAVLWATVLKRPSAAK